MSSDLAVSIAVSAIAYGTPLVLAGLGELLAERSGVLNLGVEGMMLMGAVTAFFASQMLPGPGWAVLILALAAAAAAGAAMALIHAFLCSQLCLKFSNHLKSCFDCFVEIAPCWIDD